MNFKSVLYQTGNSVDASQLYSDIIEQVEKEKKELNVDRLDRGHPLQHILNSTSGNYIAPTSMKSFMNCPANYLYEKLVPEDETGTKAVSIGRMFHDMMESFYNDEKRTYEQLKYIYGQRVSADGITEKSKQDLLEYINGFWEAKDYINDVPMNHQNLECSTEIFIKTDIYPLNVDIGVPVYLKLDRLDIRNEGIYVIDYKTGFGNPNEYLCGEHGYLPQMIFYKWGVEAAYGEKVQKALLMLPGADIDHKWVDMNVHSLVQQSKVIDKTFSFLEDIHEIRDKMVFPERKMMYCGSCSMKNMCNLHRSQLSVITNEVKEIPVNISY